ncbi:nucleotidyltransferase domain-containing protein [Bacillus sp. FSL W7-1360]
MSYQQRVAAKEAATQFVSQHFPHCYGAILAGSAVTGQATATSDLDMVLFEEDAQSSYRESLVAYGWPVEVFVHNLHSYKEYFASDVKRAMPSLPMMIAHGLVLKGASELAPIRAEAQNILTGGPAAWSVEEVRAKRYFITDVLDDFIGCHNKGEAICSAQLLFTRLAEFVLRTNRCWIGDGKWLLRALRKYDEPFAHDFEAAFEHFYSTGEKEAVIALAERVLAPYGGRLFVGFSIGK